MTSFLSKPKKNFVSELLMKYLYGMTIQATGNNQMPVLNITGCPHPHPLVLPLSNQKKLTQVSRKIELQ